jgi:hypothetical protein
MSKKIILTESQRDLIVDQIINEMLKDVDRDHLLNDKQISEGIWTNIKYGLSKLGRYKVGGKFGGRRKTDQEAAAKIQKIIDNKANEAIAKLDAEIKQQNPEFPNNKEPVDFLNTIMSISAVYDSIVAATQKDPKDEKYMPIDVANGVINDLREYVKKFLDIDLAAAYSTLDEAEGNIIELTEEELKQLDEAWGLNTEEYSNEEVIDEDQSADVRKQLQAKRGAGADFQSDRMKTLKSNKLPLLLAGIGGALGGLSWLAQTEWFKGWLEGLLGGDTTVTTPDIVKDVTGGAPDSKGMLHWMSSINQGEGLPPIKTGADVQSFVDRFGADKVQHMFDGNGAGPSATQVQQLQQLVGGENGAKPVGELFNPQNDTFGSMKGGQNLFGVSKAASFLGQIVVKKGLTTVVKGAGTALAAKFAGLGAVLGPIGVGVLATGALVKLMRMKGQKQSRAATLNDLYQSIRNIEGGAGVVEPEGPTIDSKEAQNPAAIENKNKEEGGGAGKGGGVNDDLYNSIRNLFQFLVNNKNTLGRGAKSGQAGNRGDRRYRGGEFMKGGDRASKGGQTQTAKQRFFAENEVNENEYIFEGQYIKDKRLISFLQKSMPFEKLKNFEDFIGRIEILRNKIRKIKTEDKVMLGFINKLNSNPIMATDFKQLFNISVDNPQAVNALKAFINDLFLGVYSGQYKFDSLIKKMGSAGGNVNKLEEEAGYNAKEPNKAFAKDAQDRGRFKGNLLKFLQELISMFSYLNKLKSQGKLGQQGGKQQTTGQQSGQQQATGQQGGEQQATGQPAANQPADNQAADNQPAANEPADQQQAQSQKKEKFKGIRLENKINNENKLLSEEINKINKLIGKIN